MVQHDPFTVYPSQPQANIPAAYIPALSGQTVPQSIPAQYPTAQAYPPQQVALQQPTVQATMQPVQQQVQQVGFIQPTPTPTVQVTVCVIFTLHGMN